MKDPIEFVLRDQPFTVRRTIRRADCDPAGVVYAGRYADYLIDSVSRFIHHTGFAVSVAKNRRVQVGFPRKHMALTFYTSLYPDDVIDIEIAVSEVREHTFDLAARASLLDGRPAFEGAFSPICINPETRTRTPIPPELREVLRHHHLDQKADT